MRAVQENRAGGVTLFLLLPYRLHTGEADSQQGATDSARLKPSQSSPWDTATLAQIPGGSYKQA